MSKFLEAERYQVEVFDPQNNALDVVQPQPRSPIKYILEQQKFRTREDMRTLRIAIDNAQNIVNFNREDLHRIYRECLRDPNLSGQWDSRKMKTKEKQFRVVRTGSKEENTKLTAILEAQWFRDWIDAVLDSQLWGFTLIETGPLVNGEFVHYNVGNRYFDPINIIERDNVKPEFAKIVEVPSADHNNGISFFDPQYSKHLMYFGKMHDFGILYSLVKYILFKDNCLGNWSEWAEVFGMDKRVGYTDADGTDRNNFIEAIQNLGTNAYGVFTKNDKIEFLGTNRTDAYGVYKELMHYIDEQVAKKIWGQDVVTNNTGRVVGTTGENIANMYGDNDAAMIKHSVNKRLFPFMQELGFFEWAGHTFEWDTAEKVGLKDKSEIDSKIAAMGFDIDEKYIVDTYGVPVTKKEPLELNQNNPDEEEKTPLEIAAKLREFYAGMGQ